MNYFTYKTNFMDKEKKTKHITQRKEKSEKVMPLCCPVSWSSGLCSLQGIHFRQHFSSWNTSCVMEPYVISSVHKVNATELTLMADNMNKHLCFIICINPAQTKTVFSIQYLNSSCPKLHALYSENCPCCTVIPPASPVPSEELTAIHCRTPAMEVITSCFHGGSWTIALLLHNSFQLLLFVTLLHALV